MLTTAKKRLTVTALLIVGTVFLLFTLPLETIDISNSAQKHSKMVLKESSLQNFDKEGKLIWELFAKKIGTDEASNRTEATHVKINFKRKGKKDLMVIAQKLTMYNKTALMIMEGEVLAESEDLKLRTQKLEWDGEKRVLQGKTKVSIQYRNLGLTGHEFQYSPSQDVLTLKGEAHLELIPKRETKNESEIKD